MLIRCEQRQPILAKAVGTGSGPPGCRHDRRQADRIARSYRSGLDDIGGDTGYAFLHGPTSVQYGPPTRWTQGR